MNVDKINSLCISDIHLGHPRNKTENIIKNMVTYIQQVNKDRKLDILFIAGDLFDTCLNLSKNEVNDITLYVGWLLRYCSQNKIILRVLEGTPSHDWKQSNIFNSILEILDIEVNFKYVDILHIEYLVDFDIHILYVPDEWNQSTDKTFEEVKELLKQKNIDKVDLAIMHGQFDYQLPKAAIKVPKHNEVDYLSIVKYYILIGHVHISSIFERILAQGSFDRLSHNEESAKGGFYFTIYKDGKHEYFFIENKNAKVFKTIVCNKKDLDINLKLIDKEIKRLPIDSFVRIKASKDNPILFAIDDIKKKYIYYTISKITFEEEVEEESLELISEINNIDYIPITITKDNIENLLLDEVNKKYHLDNNSKHVMLKELSQVL